MLVYQKQKKKREYIKVSKKTKHNWNEHTQKYLSFIYNNAY
jgi:hypothetical protein